MAGLQNGAPDHRFADIHFAPGRSVTAYRRNLLAHMGVENV
ncbi:MAG TPA: hypothetical protein VFQ91_22945 [Bryobacteraceae bacterium]|nr:hypothetical protein [Bryobacteraceae bacterium]